MILSPENELIVRDSPTMEPDGFAKSWKLIQNLDLNWMKQTKIWLIQVFGWKGGETRGAKVLL